MDRAVAALRLPPAARIILLTFCALASLMPASPAAALSLAPAPVRMAIIWGRPLWSQPASLRMPPPPLRWEAGWGQGDPFTSLPARSPHG